MLRWALGEPIFVWRPMKCSLSHGQRPKNHRGIVALPSGKFLRVRKVFARNPWKWIGKFADHLQNFQIGWIFSGWSGKFLDSLESFRIVWIFSGLSGKFSDSLESFRIIWIFSGLSGKFPDSLDIFWIVAKYLHLRCVNVRSMPNLVDFLFI